MVAFSYPQGFWEDVQPLIPCLHFFFFFLFFLKWRFAYAHKFHSFCQDQCTGAQQAEMTETDTTSLRIHSGHTAGLRQPMLFTEAQHCKSRDYVFHSELLGSYVVVSHHETDLNFQQPNVDQSAKAVKLPQCVEYTYVHTQMKRQRLR